MTTYSDTSLALTYSDIVARLRDRIGYASDDAPEERKTKRAVRDALRDLPTKNNWTYYNREWQFFTSASVSLNITYTHSTKTAVVNSGTIPSDVVHGQFFYRGIRCLIDSVDGSTLTLHGTQNPGEDLTATNILWTRQTYPAPSITKINGIWRVHETRPLQYVTPQELAYRDSIWEGGTPVIYSVVNASVLGNNDIMISPPPSVREAYRVSAIVAPSAPTVFRDESEATGSSGAFTFTAPEATSGWVGCVVRAAPASSNKREDIINEDWSWQAIITAVAGTTVTVNIALPSTFTAETVIVSSLIDIDREAMQTYFEALAYAYYARNMANKDREAAEALAIRAFRDARAADSQVDRSSTPSYVAYARYGGVFPDLRFARGGQ